MRRRAYIIELELKILFIDQNSALHLIEIMFVIDFVKISIEFFLLVT